MNEVASIWTTKEIITAVIATGIVSAVASWVVDLIKSWYGRKKAAQYGAMRSAVALERYAVSCWHIFIMGEGEFERHRDVTSVRLPPAPDLPADVDWKAIDASLADDILSFSNSSNVSEALAEFSEVWEQNPFDFHDAAKERGLEALKLAGRIRKHYRMKSHNDFDRLWKDFRK
ncbi:hypothetical protein [Mesorhizobium sp. KR1-2]|uniref:hypothetical protein n=1 Tax=Mesorhizobium sp. KR1-2 TaxID=3156609 RepID=UPI0032B6044C